MHEATASAGFRYQQLAAELEEKISSGLYKAGERLPSLYRPLLIFSDRKSTRLNSSH